MGKSLAAAVVVALVTGCNYGAASFNCTTDQQCGAAGKCETTFGGLCSFSDSTCPSGRRFGELAGGNSNRCVGEQPTDAGVDVAIDAAIDAPPDAPPDAQACFGGTFLTVCLNSAPAASRTISAPETINTDDTGMCTPTLSITPAGNYCVVAATDITINAKLRATGTRPLILLASGSITTAPAGLIDVGSHRITPGGTTEKGAGADSAACDAGTLPTGGANGGGAGGAGGSFFGLGGDGGNGGNGGTSGKHGAAVTSVSVLRGGCPGQDGQATSGLNGLGGRGGGAVYLIAGVQISVQGGINAAGEGGAGGAQNVGGAGGGGSGGMIGFDAPVITNNSLLLASGGGGGGGGGSGGANTEGGAAQDPLTIAAANHGVGFMGNGTFGGDGGNGSGSTITNAPGGAGNFGDPGGTNKGGGGGGGGGAGHIKAPNTANLGGNISPPRSP